MKQASGQHRVPYYPTPMRAKVCHNDFYSINPALAIVDEAHECNEPGAGHFGIFQEMDSKSSHSVKKVFLTGTPIRKGPGDLISMINALHDMSWEVELN